MARPSARSWRPWLLGALALGAALAYLFSPVRVVITGMGTVEPVFEELSVPTNKWACVVDATTHSPSEIHSPGAPPPALLEARLLYQRSFDRAQALRRWSALIASAERPREWEGRLAQRLSIRNERAERLGAPVLITLTSRPRPRIWQWLNGA